MKNKNGFTLVELLAVIVILAIVMLIGGTTVLPMMQKAQKNSLGEEGLAAIKSAEKTFTTDSMSGSNAPYKSTDTVCYSLKYLCQNGYFDKGCDQSKDKYTGSVLVKHNNDGTYDYYFWISNGTYVFNASTKENYADIDNPNILFSGSAASTDCGNEDIPVGTPSGTSNIITEVINTGANVVHLDSDNNGQTVTETLSKKLLQFSVYHTQQKKSFYYQYEEGMTWKEYFSSSYVPAGAFADSSVDCNPKHDIIYLNYNGDGRGSYWVIYVGDWNNAIEPKEYVTEGAEYLICI